MDSLSRREILSIALSGLVGDLTGGAGDPTELFGEYDDTDQDTSRADEDTDRDGFDPSIHGFGFANWAGDTGEGANGEEFTYEPADVSLEEVQSSIEGSWETTLSDAQAALMSRIILSWIGNNAATNGHCFGMSFSADEYFQDPSNLPENVDVASGVPYPTEEYTAIGDRIRVYQTSHLLRAESFWFGLFNLRWGLPDHQDSTKLITEEIDETGTSGVVLDGELGPHQVLAYDYHQQDTITEIHVYDPNIAAQEYDDTDDIWTISADKTTGAHEIDTGYDEFLSFDPDINPDDVPPTIGGHDAVLDQLSDAMFIALESEGSLEIDLPDDVLIDRPDAEYADPEGGPYADSAVILQAPDELEVAIDAEAGVEYSLEVIGVRDGEIAIDKIISDTIEEATPAQVRLTVDETGEFVVDATDEAVEGADTTSAWIEDNWWVAVAGGALGLGAAYRLLKKDDRDE